MIRFKYPELKTQFMELRGETEIITLTLAGYIEFQFNKDLFITSIFRPGEPLHGDWRAVDFRIQQGIFNLVQPDPVFSPHELKNIEAYLGIRFIYDPSRPEKKVLVIHENRINGQRGGPTDGIHGHIQSYPGLTRIR